MPKMTRLAVFLAGGIVVVLVIVAALWWFMGRQRARTELSLYGNVDLRQVELPFNGSERIAAVLVQEGDHVKQGQLLAQLETSRLAPQVAKAEADVAVQQQAVDRLHHGNRPEEIGQARANVDAAAADAANARAQYERLRTLSDSSSGRAVSRQDMDAAKAALDTADARLAVNQKALALQLAGPRKEDVAQGDAQLRADQAQLALLQQQLKDADLLAPLDAVVRSRIVEPGEIASPQKAAFTLAITDPKWVRAYVGEPDLGSVHEGMSATVTVDAFNGRRFAGWVGFISPVAEFTPKSVETTELRSSLVYEIRVFVHDPADELRLGMPATVHLSLRRDGA
ncbi:MAG TPA: HlyD family efflux transporter periplasmic adaptor subunit [Steroidobacteraceae bacterium]|jgi:HlyD family secretion protein|nr:HlyD family efflux transporter periplasmic adaptor subunit [Steroidobacteraceae bacterium]